MMRSFAIGMAAVVLLATTALPVTGARAATTTSIAAGRSITSSGRWTTSAFVNVAFDNTFTWQDMEFRPVATLGWVKGRHTQVDNLNHNVYVGGAGLRLVNWWGGAFSAFSLAQPPGAPTRSAVAVSSSARWAGLGGT